MHSLHDVHKMDALGLVVSVQLENRWIDFDEIWCTFYAIGDHLKNSCVFTSYNR
jgi:hypothetical protein